MTSFLSPENNSDLLCPLPNANSSKSFWHSEPDEFLIGHRTTPELPSTADVVIVGCGITGANAARFLVESGKGLSVVILEAREVCWGATGRVSQCLCCFVATWSVHMLLFWYTREVWGK